MGKRWVGAFLITILAAGVLTAQEVEDRTLLSHEQMTAIVNEASGDRAMHHLLELVPYQRVRPPEEYQGPYRESRVMADLARDYGFSNVSIEVYQSGGTAWQPTRGELWMSAPGTNTKLYDIYDIPLSLASLNANGDISGELVDVGNGEDFADIDVAGKFVLASGNLRGAYAQAVERGALGALAISAIGAERIVDYPDQIVSTSVSASVPETAAWALTPETYASLATRLARGETVTIRSIVDSVEVPSKAEYVHAEIPGDGSTTQEVGISAHLYEGVIKQGANDDNSGCALTLEIGRAYIKLINEGLLPRPKRTINFQWVPEISGTNAYLNAHPDKAANMIADLNFDMEGIRLTASRSFWILQRTPDTFPSFLNDIAQSMMEY
ncbi:MAG: M28 family peptidase, partial [Acidobacteriota bacterium]